MQNNNVIQSEAKNLDCVMWALQRSFALNDKLKDDRVFFKRGHLFLKRGHVFKKDGRLFGGV